jgi:hypothetical protein
MPTRSYEENPMLTLYYSTGACSIAPHIALEETGASYALHLVSIPKGEHQAPEYLQNVNPWRLGSRLTAAMSRNLGSRHR